MKSLVFNYFDLSEFDSPDAPGSGLNMNKSFVFHLDLLRAECGFPLFVVSGYRTPEHNKEVGGTPNSSHLKGLAADLKTSSSKQRYKLLGAAIKLGFRRIGINKNTIHLDVDPDKAQGVIWTYYK